MTTISTGTATVAGVGIRAEGFGGDVQMGLPADRDGGRAEAALDTVLRRVAELTDGSATLAVRAELTVHPSWPGWDPSRSGEPVRLRDEEPRLFIDGPALGPDEIAQIAVVEEDGLLRFVLPADGTVNHFEIPLGDSLASYGGDDRGLSFRAAALAIRVIGVLGGRKAANAGFRLAVRAIEDRARPPGLRTFLSDGFRRKPDARSKVTFSSGPSALLLLHGVISSSHSCFRFPTDFMKLLERRYDGRVIAFDHPTLGASPRENAEELAELLGSFRLDNVDIVAHSRGGLVAREFAANAPEGVTIRSIVHVATPNGGTPLADADHLGQFLSVATNVIGFIPDNPVTEVVGIVLEVLREWVLQPAAELPGHRGDEARQPRPHRAQRRCAAGHRAAGHRLGVRAAREPGRPHAPSRPGDGRGLPRGGQRPPRADPVDLPPPRPVPHPSRSSTGPRLELRRRPQPVLDRTAGHVLSRTMARPGGGRHQGRRCCSGGPDRSRGRAG